MKGDNSYRLTWWVVLWERKLALQNQNLPLQTSVTLRYTAHMIAETVSTGGQDLTKVIYIYYFIEVLQKTGIYFCFC
jgi:hypothetical protein